MRIIQDKKHGYARGKLCLYVKIAALILELNAQKADMELVSEPYIDDAKAVGEIMAY